jgi:choline dehydrogenase
MFDYIVVGGGSAGCVLAARLSEDPKNSVLLVEAGPDDWHPLHKTMIYMPGGAAECLKSNVLNWQDYTVPQKHLDNRKLFVPRGKMLGGSSSINGMVYIRGNAWDYDSWAQQGNQGWSYAGVLPYFKRSEDNVRGASEYHGVGGGLRVIDSPAESVIYDRFVDAGVEAGHPRCVDFNGKDQEGFGRFQATIRDTTRQRCSSAAAFLTQDVRARPNLKIASASQVTQIILDGKRASGIEYVQKKKQHRVNANKEIILCSGALKSPHILQLSGIGNGADLKAAGITVKHELPGVGYNLQEHLDVTVNYGASELTHNADATQIHRMALTALQYFIFKKGIAACNMIEGGAFVKSSPALSVPDIQMHYVPVNMTGLVDPLPKEEGMTTHACLLRPKSRGSIKPASNDVLQKPLVDFNFLSDDTDMKTLVKCYELIRDVMAAKAWKGAVTHSIRPNAVLEKQQDIEAYVRANADTVYHPVGSCKMGSDAMAVVDDQLRVHGLEGLRVADASIIPDLIGGNTNAPAIMIGEKCADLIMGKQLPAAVL